MENFIGFDLMIQTQKFMSHEVQSEMPAHQILRRYDCIPFPVSTRWGTSRSIDLVVGHKLITFKPDVGAEVSAISEHSYNFLGCPPLYGGNVTCSVCANKSVTADVGPDFHYIESWRRKLKADSPCSSRTE
jgi:hypothetical protein